MAQTKEKSKVAQETKFEQLISMTGNQLLRTRGSVISAQTERVFRRALMDAQDKVDTIKAKIMDLEDLGVETSDSLKPAKGFNAEAWVKEVVDLNVKLYNAEIALSVVTDNYNKYFGTPGAKETTSETAADPKQ